MDSFYIWSNQHGAFYRPEARGYTIKQHDPLSPH